MRKITPHLWFDKEAKEAAEFYTSLFPNSKVTNITTLHDTPSGDADSVSFELDGQPFMAISAGPIFKINPSVSFHVRCKDKDDVNALWEKLSSGGTPLMELGAYPFSEWFGWIQDRYGVSWQVISTGGKDFQQKFVPMVMFVGNVCGKAEEALNFYTSVFKNAPSQTKPDETHVEILSRYGKGEDPDMEGTVRQAQLF